MAADPPSERDEGRWLIWTLLVAAAAFVLGVIGLAMSLRGEQRPLDLAYHSLQLFVLSSDPLQGNGPHNPLLEIARFVAPATTVYTVFRACRSVLREGLRRRAIARLVGHIVVTGDSAASLVLAGNLRASGVTVVLVGGEAAARQLLDRYPPRAASAVIVGFGEFGQALLRAHVRRLDPDGGSLSITVQTDDTELVAQLEQTQGRTIQVRPRQAVDAVKADDAVFVCLEDEDAALRTALKLARTVDGRVVLCLHRESPFRQALMETPGLGIFGILDAACTPEHITADAVIGKLARAVHNRYVESCGSAGKPNLQTFPCGRGPSCRCI
jgi:hypothetical protein